MSQPSQLSSGPGVSVAADRVQSPQPAMSMGQSRAFRRSVQCRPADLPLIWTVTVVPEDSSISLESMNFPVVLPAKAAQCSSRGQ